MEILNDNYNYKAICAKCDSEFTYNKDDLKIITNEIERPIESYPIKTFKHCHIFVKYVNCPLCGKVFLHSAKEYYTKI